MIKIDRKELEKEKDFIILKASNYHYDLGIQHERERVLGLNKEVFHNHNKHPATDEFSKGFEHACNVIEKELIKRIKKLK